MPVRRERRPGRPRTGAIAAIALVATLVVAAVGIVGGVGPRDRSDAPTGIEAIEGGDQDAARPGDRPAPDASDGPDVQGVSTSADEGSRAGGGDGPTGPASSTSGRASVASGQQRPAGEREPRPAPDPPADPTRPPAEPPAEPPADPPGPSRPSDVAACANLGHVAIGDATGGDDGVRRAAPRFRAEAAAVLASEPLLVCATPIEAWRDDLYVQALFAGGARIGMLIGGRDDADPIIRVTRNEWAGWGWRSDHNFVGVPTGRATIDGVEVILTTRGGVVVEHPDSMAIPVVNGAWGMWMQRGGPSGDMGMPVGRAQGMARIATWQDFVGGRVVLPWVETDHEAEAQPLERYSWMPWSAFDDPPITEVPGRSVVENAGASYFVAEDGKRYWIRTGGDWECARDMGAAMLGAIEGRILTTIPIGGEYRCGM